MKLINNKLILKIKLYKINIIQIKYEENLKKN